MDNTSLLSRFCGFVCFGIPLTGLKGPLRGSPSDPLVAWWRSTSSSRVWSGAGLLVVGERSRLGGYQAASLFRRHLQPPRVQSSASPGGLGTNAALVGREAKASGLDSEAGAMNGAASGAISSLPPTPSLIGQRSTPSLVGQSIIDEVVSSRIQRQLKSGENRVTESDDAEFADNEDNDNEEKVGTEIGLTRPRDIFSLSRRIPDRRSNMCSSSVSDKPRQQTPVSEMSSSITGPTRTVSGRLDILVVGGADHLLRMHSSSCQRWSMTQALVDKDMIRHVRQFLLQEHWRYAQQASTSNCSLFTLNSSNPCLSPSTTYQSSLDHFDPGYPCATRTTLSYPQPHSSICGSIGSNLAPNITSATEIDESRLFWPLSEAFYTQAQPTASALASHRHHGYYPIESKAALFSKRLPIMASPLHLAQQPGHNIGYSNLSPFPLGLTPAAATATSPAAIASTSLDINSGRQFGFASYQFLGCGGTAPGRYPLSGFHPPSANLYTSHDPELGSGCHGPQATHTSYIRTPAGNRRPAPASELSSWLQASRAAHTADMATIIPMHQTNVVSWREPFVGQSTASPNSRFGHPNAGPTGKRRNLASLEPGGEVAVPPGYDSATSPSTGHINTDFSLCRASLLTTSSPGTCSEPEIIAQNGAISVAKSARLSLMTRFGSSEMMTQPTRSWSRLLAVDSTRCPSSPGTGGGIAYTPSPPYHATGYSQGVSHGAAITGTDIGISLHGSSFPASRPIPCSTFHHLSRNDDTSGSMDVETRTSLCLENSCHQTFFPSKITNMVSGPLSGISIPTYGQMVRGPGHLVSGLVGGTGAHSDLGGLPQTIHQQSPAIRASRILRRSQPAARNGRPPVVQSRVDN